MRGTVERIEARLEAVGARAVTAYDDGYPSALRGLDPHPPVLYVRGTLLPLEAPTVAVVGTRRASGYGRTVAAEIADELARAGATVVSGLALGIDGEAHAAAVTAGGASVAVLPSPVDRVYPPRHVGLAERLVAQGGAVVSEVAPGAQVGKPDFARRNRIIAGLAIAVVVVEAPDHSGALLTASAATHLGREVYAVPGPIHAAASRGCNRLIADHDATLVTSAVGLLHQIGVARGRAPVSVSALSDAEALVLAHLLERPASIEELIDRTRHGTSALASALTLLEARGLVTTYGGATFFATLAARRIGRGARTGRFAHLPERFRIYCERSAPARRALRTSQPCRRTQSIACNFTLRRERSRRLPAAWPPAERTPRLRAGRRRFPVPLVHLRRHAVRHQPGEPTAGRQPAEVDPAGQHRHRDPQQRPGHHHL